MAGATPFWSQPVAELSETLGTAVDGLSIQEAKTRLARFGPNTLRKASAARPVGLLLGQFKSPLVLMLLFACVLSFFLHDPVDAVIILAIVVASGMLSFWQEFRAQRAVASLAAMVRVNATVRRDGRELEVPLEEVVPGDVVALSTGDTIPGDCRVLESKELFTDEATLTGESYPQAKEPGELPAETPLAARSNVLFMGTHVVSGHGVAQVVRTGSATEFGAIADRLRLRPQETEFEHGVRRLGQFLMEVMLLLVLAIFACNVYLDRHVLDSLLFSLALAVGLTPQLLPAIISVNLSHGARRMATVKVVVRRLASIEDFGSMDVLCSDKTGTLTEGRVRVERALDSQGVESAEVLQLAAVNAAFQSGFRNPIDRAIVELTRFEPAGYRKLDELPYDFDRRRLSVLVEAGASVFIVTKGALDNVLRVCTSAGTPTRPAVPLAPLLAGIKRQYEELSRQGYRTLGVAFRRMDGRTSLDRDDENGMTFAGFLVLADPPKSDVRVVLNELAGLGVRLKMITGDNHLVAESVGRLVGLATPRVLTGGELRAMTDEALVRQAPLADIFAEVEPNQKERIILALRKAGHVVGFMGDGINDASALHAANVGISVAGAADVAKEAADIVLLEHDLGVLAAGVREGRGTFANTLKYVFMASSANFGNMFSMAGASLLLPFLPLLPKQILLTNLLTDFPEMTIATDSVDRELVERPRRWNITFIRRFMTIFGLLSSVFDYLTFGVLLFLLHASTEQFRTGWFVESVVSATVIVLVVRSRRPFFASRPSPMLVMATALVIIATLLLPYTQVGHLFGLAPLPLRFLFLLALIVAIYVTSAEFAKYRFYRSAAL
jgi:Mg2+-importing ATPase